MTEYDAYDLGYTEALDVRPDVLEYIANSPTFSMAFMRGLAEVRKYRDALRKRVNTLEVTR